MMAPLVRIDIAGESAAFLVVPLLGALGVWLTLRAGTDARLGGHRRPGGVAPGEQPNLSLPARAADGRCPGDDLVGSPPQFS